MNTFIANKYNVFIAFEEEYGVFNDNIEDFQQIRPESDGFEHKGTTELLKRSHVSPSFSNVKSLSGAPSCSLKMKLPLRGGGAEMLNEQLAEVCNELAVPLDVIAGSRIADSASVIDSGGTLSEITLPSSTSMDGFTVGGLVFLKHSSTGQLEGRWISAIDSETYTVSVDGWNGNANWVFSSIPAVEDMLYGSINYSSLNSSNLSCCIEVSGITIGGEQPVWRYSGLVGNLKISDAAVQKRIMLDFELKGDDYSCDTDDPLISISTGANSWPQFPYDLKSLGAEFRINGVKTAYQSFSLDIGNNWSEIHNANKSTGRSGYALTSRNTNGKAVVYWNSEWTQKFKSGDTIDISWIVGDHVNGAGFHAPKAELQEIKETEINGLLAMEISFVPLESEIEGIPDWMFSLSGKRG